MSLLVRILPALATAAAAAAVLVGTALPAPTTTVGLASGQVVIDDHGRDGTVRTDDDYYDDCDRDDRGHRYHHHRFECYDYYRGGDNGLLNLHDIL